MYITRAIINFAKRYHLRIGKSVIVGFIMSAISTLWMISIGGIVAIMVEPALKHYELAFSLGAMLFMSVVKFMAKKLN